RKDVPPFLDVGQIRSRLSCAFMQQSTELGRDLAPCRRACRPRHGAVVLVVVDEQNAEHTEQSGGFGNEHDPLRASNIDTYGSPFTMMHCTPEQFMEGHATRGMVVVVVVVVAPRCFRHSRAAARQSARQPAGAGVAITSASATTAAT